MNKSQSKVLVVAALIVFLILLQLRAQSIYTPYAFTNLAGIPGAGGINDNTNSSAQFYNPSGVAVDSAGNVYIADTSNHTVRKIAPDGQVTTIAGSARQQGCADGRGSAAQFSSPSGVAVDNVGIVYVADTGNHTIRKITPDGWVTTLAGNPGNIFSPFLTNGANGVGSDARFNSPSGVAVDPAGNVFVADSASYTIRKITPGGFVTTLAGSPNQSGSANGTGSAARFGGPASLAIDSATNVYVADRGISTIRKITPAGVVTTLAGSGNGSQGSADGTGVSALFLFPAGVAVDSSNNVYVADTYNHTIRKISPAGVVVTLAGSVRQAGTADGAGTVAQFNRPTGLAVDSTGNIYVADYYNNRIAKGAAVTSLSPLHFVTSAGKTTVSNGSFLAQLAGPSGSNVVTESSANLKVWSPLQTNSLPHSGLDISLPLGTNQKQFFRARLVP